MSRVTVQYRTPKTDANTSAAKRLYSTPVAPGSRRRSVLSPPNGKTKCNDNKLVPKGFDRYCRCDSQALDRGSGCSCSCCCSRCCYCYCSCCCCRSLCCCCYCCYNSCRFVYLQLMYRPHGRGVQCCWRLLFMTSILQTALQKTRCVRTRAKKKATLSGWERRGAGRGGARGRSSKLAAKMYRS